MLCIKVSSRKLWALKGAALSFKPLGVSEPRQVLRVGLPYVQADGVACKRMSCQSPSSRQPAMAVETLPARYAAAIPALLVAAKVLQCSCSSSVYEIVRALTEVAGSRMSRGAM